jgi:26S proteasome regulatory subunit N8
LLLASERVVGWYSSGPKIRPNDIDINELLRKYTPDPVLCVIEAKSTELGLPTKSYVSVEKVNSDGTTSMTFKHVESQIGAVEAEEVGVEHLLRDIHDTSVSTLTMRVQDKVVALKSLVEKLREVDAYLGYVTKRTLPPNQALMDTLQTVFNLLPNLNTAEMVDAFACKTNDSLLTIYLASLIRSIVALHELINNRITNRHFETKTFGFVADAAVTGTSK